MIAYCGDGWIVCDKPSGVGCVTVGRFIKRCTKQKRVGHVGTLDPLATGVVTFAVGQATKLIPYLHHPFKTYEFDIGWGQATNTDDASGHVTQVCSIKPDVEAVRRALPHFIGQQKQVPPRYAAIHINGVRAYALARSGTAFEQKERSIIVKHLDWTSDRCFRVTCQAGTYVRALARDIAQFLGTVGHVAWLRRVNDGLFSVDHDQIWTGLPQDTMPIMALDVPIKHLSALWVQEEQMLHLSHGRSIVLTDLKQEQHTQWVRVYHGGRLRAVARLCDDGHIKPHRLLCV